ncbi:cysteine hydrolase family protein [Lacisediminihabitans sp.]|uniref:cysteine hydrolase family protein n=1 Tax=Lacisediminihabitans sp. TaxID=2787631 RepID=UPI00374C9EE4
MTKALLVIDIQNDYFPGGAYSLVGSEAAGEVAHRILEDARSAGMPIVHLRHVSVEEDATFFLPGTSGAEIHPLLAPAPGELVLTKSLPNAFVDTALEPLLREGGIDGLVIVGMMSSMCVDATSRAALDLGLDVTVVHDACAAPDLEFEGTELPGSVVHAAFMAALRDAGATVVASTDLRA